MLASLFLLLLVVGLVLGVFAMLFGTERARVAPPPVAPHERAAHDVRTEPSPLRNLATVAALVFATGLTGSLLTRYTAVSAGRVLFLALLAGGAAFTLQALLFARWAIPSARADVPDERYRLQGVHAEVVDAAPAEGEGRLRYVLDGHTVELPVRGLDGQPLPVGTEVVIDRIEQGVAWAEPWALVEQRL